MENKILEICQDITGRRKLKIVLHEIYPDENHWNINGITYLEQYTRDNADTVKGMPLCKQRNSLRTWCYWNIEQFACI